MKKGNIDSFCAYLEQQVANHSGYVLGSQGQCGSQITEYWIRKMEQNTGGKKVNGKYCSYADLAVDFWKTQCAKGYGSVMAEFDCSGLGVYWLLKNDVLGTDRTANGLYRMCEVTDKPKRGYWVFRLNDEGRATHIGYCVSDSEVIHAKGRVEGVIKEKYSASYWHKVGVPNCMDFSEQPSPKPEPIGTKYVHPKGNVRVREGNGTQYKVIKPTATKKDYLPLLGQDAEAPYWYLVEWQGRQGFISSNSRYTEVVER